MESLVVQKCNQTVIVLTYRSLRTLEKSVFRDLMNRIIKE